MEKDFEIEFVGEIVEDSPDVFQVGKTSAGLVELRSDASRSANLDNPVPATKVVGIKSRAGTLHTYRFVAALAAVDQQGLASARREVGLSWRSAGHPPDH
jgi:hypothetical protein